MLLMNLVLNRINVKSDMKKKTIKWIKLILKFLLPAFIGWLEGDKHAIADAITDLMSVII